MKTKSPSLSFLLALSSAAVLVLAAAGCSKQETVSVPDAAPTNAPAQAQAAPAAVAPPPANPEAFQPDLPPPVQEMVQVDRRLQQRDYEGAVDILLRAQAVQRPLTAAQRADLINPDAVFYKMDICGDSVGEVLTKRKIEIINHHAAQIDLRKSVEDPKFDINVNATGSVNLLENGVKNK